MRNWCATHRITNHDFSTTTYMMLHDGVAYTRQEWFTYDRADYECDPETGEWLFLEAPFNGTVKRLEPAQGQEV